MAVAALRRGTKTGMFPPSSIGSSAASECPPGGRCFLQVLVLRLSCSALHAFAAMRVNELQDIRLPVANEFAYSDEWASVSPFALSLDCSDGASSQLRVVILS